MIWDFFNLAKKHGLDVHEPNEAPHSPGYYLLFTEDGNFIYVGKASDLRERLDCHKSDQEENDVIRTHFRHAIWRTTDTEEDAAAAEAEIFDRWVRITGEHPLANKNRPEGSTVTDEEMFKSKLSVIFNRETRLGRSLPPDALA